MRIALIGYGKMGRIIEEIALQRGHEIVLKINSSNREAFNGENMSQADVAIEFTNPESAYQNVKQCIDFGVPVVCGSTGWNAKLDEMKQYALKKNASFLHASNFSIGVNIFFAINKHLARLMAQQPSYSVSIKEIHHTAKKDAPSGTAVTLAEQIIAAMPAKNNWVNETTNDPGKIGIVSERVDPAPGTHHIKYDSKVDSIEIIHTAHNRNGFALGAVLAAEFIAGKKGIFSMSDVLKF